MAENKTPECETDKSEPAGFAPEVGNMGDADEAAEGAYYLETLKANRRIAGPGEPLDPGQTHQIETDEKGHEILRRKRFSAV
ncbi:MAG: hypothetical protein ACJ76N_01150 [Thermoanaerobaculia bacterium]